MTDTLHTLVALLLAAIPAGALVSGKALGVWWRRALVSRADQPAAYWTIVAVQCAILLVFIWTGRSWRLR